MKRYLILIILMALASMVFGQSKSVESLYQKYKNDKDFFHMDLAGSFLGFAEGMNLKLDEANLDAVTKSVKRFKFFKLPNSSTQSETDFNNLQKGLKREKYDLLMDVTDKDNNIAVYSKGGNTIHDLVVLIGGKKQKGEYIVIELEGEFDAKALADAGNKVVVL